MDAEAKKLVEAYKWETDDELKRKREVYRALVIHGTQDEIRAKAASLDDNRGMYEALSKIIRQRERTKRVGGEVFRWFGFAGPFILGLLTSGLLVG